MIEQQLILLKNTTLLIVEDDKLLLDNLYNTLIIFFKKVVIAKDGEEAWSIFKTQAIDVVITDYVMKNCDGYKLCQNIRSINEEIPLVIMSNHCDTDKLLNSIPLNLTQYLVKPINYQTLVKTLMEIVDKLTKKNLLQEVLCDDIIYDKSSKNLLKNETTIALTKNEVELLELFLKQKNNVVSNSLIEYELSKDEIKSEQAIRNIIHRLRKKLGKDIIVNVQGMGYILKSDQ